MADWTIAGEGEIVLHLSAAEARAVIGSILSFVPRFHDEFMDTILGIDFDEFAQFAGRIQALGDNLADTQESDGRND